LSLGIEEDVARLEIAVQDAALVGVVDRTGHRRQQPGGGPRVLPEPRQVLAEVAAVDQLHAEVVLALVFPDLVDRHDVRVVEPRGGLRLDAEALHVSLGCQLAGEDHLERDRAVETDLACLVDDAHPPAGDLLQQLVVPKVAYRGRRPLGARFPSRGQGRGGSLGAQRPGHPVEPILVGEECLQLGG
jgi:hypothetical protein